ncbi:MAG: hypothetical protein U9Q77_02805 [Candidatus Marinimicrobia bacterium]|nr:hypothetical protein [Candidatus Neomarinimicrobiota bacterium]
MTLTPDQDTEEENANPMRMGPYRHVLLVAKELNMTLTALADLIDTNQIAFIRPKWLLDSRIYVHKDWVDAAKAKFPVVKFCMLHKHLLMDDHSFLELRKLTTRKKPKVLASQNQIDTLQEILDSDYILQGERKWILPIFDEKWIGSVRIGSLIDYFLGVKYKNTDGSWDYITQGVFRIRRDTLTEYYEKRKELALINHDTF